MKIIISPAKKMNIDTDSLPYENLPQFINEAEILMKCLQAMDYDELKELWRCNDSIAKLNYQRLQGMDLRHNLTPAVLSFQGIQYQYMAPGVFENKHYEYIQKHLRILSGFYGLLRPFDGVTPYRLEMQASLKFADYQNLYDFWGDRLARQLCAETNIILNLASKEYSMAVSTHLPTSVPLITCTFGELRGGKVISKGTHCKMARGEMVRWMAEHNITDPEELKGFNCLEYIYSYELSTEDNFVFINHRL